MGAVPSTEQRWRERVGAWRASGLTAAAFASGEAFSASTLRWWSSRLGRAPSVTFLELLPRPRGYASAALGYARNQVGPLRRFLEDGRLRLENNGSERALRPVAAARKSWLFFGSDDHASAAANLFSLVASCKLHGLDPESYLADVIRVMPYWPRARYLELAPRYWADTRGRLDADELARPIGLVTVPPPRATEEQTTTE